jgi:putative DNA primase/helicase
MTAQQNQELSALAEQVGKRAAELTAGLDQPVKIDDKFRGDCLKHNERGDGIFYATLNRGKYLCNASAKDNKSEEWFVWQDHCWRLDDYNESLDAVEDVALGYQDKLDRLALEIKESNIDGKHQEAWKLKVRDKYRARCERLRGLAGARKARQYAPIVDHTLACKEEEFDNHPDLLPVKNGVIDLRTGALTNGRPADLLTRRLDVDYDPRADYEHWQICIDEITGSPEVASFVKRSLGYAITGHSFEQFIWIFVGPGRNGKGTMFDLLGDIMGPYFHEISRAMLLEQRNEPSPSAASEHKYSLLRKRIIVGAETNKGQKIDPGAIKALTGENWVVCRPNFKSEIRFKPTHSVFLDTNNIPHGLTREFSLIQRLLIINFPFRFVDDPAAEARKNPTIAESFRLKDKHLKERLRACKPGILRWLVEGCLEWRERGLDPPAEVMGQVSDLAKAEDYLGEFMADCLTHHDHEMTRISISKTYDVFRWWWSHNKGNKGRPALQTITKELRERGYQVDKKGGRYWFYRYIIMPELEQEVVDYVRDNPLRS